MNASCPINLNIVSLQYFIVSMETGSFSKAAELLHTTQPNVSRHIRNLENDLGTRLFIRAPTQTVPTAAGLHCLDIARRIVSLAVSLRCVAQEEASSLRGILRIGYASNSFRAFIEDYENFFSRSFPSVELSFQNGPFSDLKTDLLEGRIDLLFMFFSGFHGISGLSQKIIRPARLHLIVPEKHPFLCRQAVTLHDLKEEHILLCGDALSSFALDMITHLSQDQKDLPTFTFESYEDNLDAMLERVRSGTGVLLTAYRLPKSSETGVHVLPVLYPLSPSKYDMSAAWKTDNDNPCILPFIEGAVTFQDTDRS